MREEERVCVCVCYRERGEGGEREREREERRTSVAAQATQESKSFVANDVTLFRRYPTAHSHSKP
jgi:hypothetical protein